MNEITYGLCGVVTVLGGVISGLAIYARDQTKKLEEARKDQVEQAENHSKAKEKIYSLWMASENLIRTECRQELKVLLDKDQELILSVTKALHGIISSLGSGGNGNADPT